MFGFTTNGPNVSRIEGRNAQFRIFDHTRTISYARAPGTGPATIPTNPVASVPVQMARFHEKVPLDFEQLSNLSPLSGPNAQIDQGGQDYISKQEGYISERLNNVFEFLTAGFLRGILYFKMAGENLIPYLTVPSGNYISVNFQLPSGNQNQLNMTGGGNIITAPWSNQNTPIIQHLLGVKAAFANLTQRPLRHVLVNSNTWYQVISNTEVRNIGGTVQSPFDSYTLVKEKGLDEQDFGTEYGAMLRADPTIMWHIMDHTLAIDGFPDPSYTTSALTLATLYKVIPDSTAVFLPEIKRDWVQMVYGSEYVVENKAAQSAVKKQGLSVWKEWVTQPSGIEIICLLNTLPVPMVAKAWAYGTISGF